MLKKKHYIQLIANYRTFIIDCIAEYYWKNANIK